MGPDEEPEIVLLLRKSQEFRFTSESPKSLKKVRIDNLVLIKEAERYITELSEEEENSLSLEQNPENHSLLSESISCVSDSVLAGGSKARKHNRLNKIQEFLKRRRNGRLREDAQSLPGTSRNSSRQQSKENLNHKEHFESNNPEEPIYTPHQTSSCFPIMKKIKNFSDRQKKRLNIKRITLRKDEKIVFDNEQVESEPKIMKLKSSPKAERSEIPHFLEKQDSDDVLEIMQLDESPSRKRLQHIEENGLSEVDNAASINTEHLMAQENEDAPKKAPRLRREHVYEEIEQPDDLNAQLNNILELASVEALKKSLAKQDNCINIEIEAANKNIPLDRMGSSEEEPLQAETSNRNLLAPLSSIDSASSEEDRTRPQLSPVAEESDAASMECQPIDQVPVIQQEESVEQLKPSIKKEASPAPSDKKVTFSHVEDEAEPHREDIELPAEVLEAAAASQKWKNLRLVFFNILYMVMFRNL